MTEQDTRNGDGAANENQPAPGAAAAQEPGAPEETLEARLQRAEQEAAEYKDRALRALAEVENIRRRGEREREETRRYAATNFARDLLTSADNLRRAIASMPEAQIKDEATKNLLAGVAATERELLAAFEKNGIRRIDPKGEKFDHNLHQAIYEAEIPGQPAGTIVEVLQPGYVLHDRLLRPAMVGVAKGGSAEPGKGQPGERVDTVA
jgi:molecular chaperone GrpE